MKRALVLVLSIPVLLSPAAALGESATLTADAYTRSTAPAANFGRRRQIFVSGPAAGTEQRGYLLFDLSTLPFGTIGSDVAKATLTLGVARVRRAGSFDVYRVLGSDPGQWGEGNLTAANAPPLATTPESPSIAVAGIDRMSFKAVDMTTLVREWLDGALPNNGVAIVGNDLTTLSFDSKETTSTAHYPRLEITLGAVSSFSGPLNGDVTGGQTSTKVTRINGTPLAPLNGVASGQVLTFIGSSWAPGNVVSSLLAGSGLSLSAANGDVTVGIPAAGVTNALLANPAIELVTGTGLGGGGEVPLGGTLSLVNTGLLSLSGVGPLSVSSGQNPTITLSGIVPLASGGTGANSASGALAALGGAARGANTDITSLGALSTPLSLGQGGTGTTNAAAALAVLGGAARGANTDITSLGALSTPLSVTQGGTGATNAATALAVLGGATRGANTDITSLGALSTPLSVAQGGTGASSAAGALSVLGAAARGVNSDITSMTGLSGVNGNILGALTSLPVYITSSGALGVVGSSARFKEGITDMGESTHGLLGLRPVRFRYKHDIDPTGVEQYGLIAEEVVRVYPELVAYGDDGRPLTVRYEAMTPMLLNEIQRQARVIDAQEAKLRQQSQAMEALNARLERLEAAVAQPPPVVRAGAL